MKMELVCLIAILVMWASNLKLQRFHQVQRESWQKSYEKRAAEFQRACEVRIREKFSETSCQNETNMRSPVTVEERVAVTV